MLDDHPNMPPSTYLPYRHKKAETRPTRPLRVPTVSRTLLFQPRPPRRSHYQSSLFRAGRLIQGLIHRCLDRRRGYFRQGTGTQLVLCWRVDGWWGTNRCRMWLRTWGQRWEWISSLALAVGVFLG
jgi:hypothetical protein